MGMRRAVAVAALLAGPVWSCAQAAEVADLDGDAPTANRARAALIVLCGSVQAASDETGITASVLRESLPLLHACTLDSVLGPNPA